MMSKNAKADEREDREAIIELFHKMAAAMDRKDWHLYESIFTEDAVADFTADYHRTGRANIVKFVREAIGACGPTHHLLGNFDVTISGNSATGSCNVRAHHRGKGDKAHLFQESLSFFSGTFRRTDDGWRIESLDEKVPIILGSVEIFPTPSPQLD
jgi:ketosteroid isomerase-like protein